MAGLRTSNGLTNLVVDTLRVRNFDGGILTVSDKGVVSNDASPEFQNLTVTGQTTLANTICESLTANSVNALASIRSPFAVFSQLDASSAVIRTLNSSSATVTQLNSLRAIVTQLDVSSASIGILDASSASVTQLNSSRATVTQLDVSSASIGTLDASSASVTQLDISEAHISFADISSAIIGYLPQFDPSGNIFTTLPGNATLSGLITSYNRLITIFANRNIFLLLSTIPLLIFQTPCEIHIAEYLTEFPNIRIDFTYSQPSQLGVAAGAIVTTLNQSAIDAGAKLRFSLNSVTSRVSYTEASGYSWVFTDPHFCGSANRFLNHLGLTGLVASENGEFSEYTSGIGAVVANPTGGSPTTPAAPGIPTRIGLSTEHGFTIRIPAAVVPSDVKKIGIFLDHGTGSIHSWDLIDYPALNDSYTFNNLVPSTTYIVHLSFLSTYDESSLSPGLSVTTSGNSYISFDVYAAIETTLTPPPLNRIYNNQFYVVARTEAEVWSHMSSLYYVNQIVSIELQYYSGFNIDTNGIEDARFSFYSYPSSPNEPPVNDEGRVLLYYTYNRRVAKTGLGNEFYAIGSSNPMTSILPSPPSSSIFISDQTTLKNMFGNGTNYIARSKGFQFAWYCGYGGSYIQNMNISKFIINYESGGVS